MSNQIAIYFNDKTETYSPEALCERIEELQGKELDVKEVDWMVWAYLLLTGQTSARYEYGKFGREFRPVEVSKEEEETEQIEMF